MMLNSNTYHKGQKIKFNNDICKVVCLSRNSVYRALFESQFNSNL